MKKEKKPEQLIFAIFLLIVGTLIIYYTLSGGTSKYLNNNFNYSNTTSDDQGIKISEDGVKEVINSNNTLNTQISKEKIIIEKGK